MVIAMRKNAIKGHLKSRPYFFRSYTSQEHERIDEGRKRTEKQLDVPLISICLATTAAPTHVKSVKVNGIGGSFRASSMDLEEQATQISDEVAKQHTDTSSPIELLVSIGGSSSSHLSSSLARSLASRKPSRKKNVDYHSFPSPSDLAGYGSEDNQNPAVSIERIRKATTAYCSDRHAELKQLAKTLVGNRRRRAMSPFWETFAMGVRYRCTACDKPGFDRIELLKHVAHQHKDSTLLTHGSTKLLDECRS